MGQFSVQVTVAHPSDPSRAVAVELLVDTGATLSWVPREVVERLGVPRLRRRSFLVADGRAVERETAGAVFRLDGSEANVTLVIAEPGDGHLLGATALESLGFGVDPIRRRLVPQELLAMHGRAAARVAPVTPPALDQASLNLSTLGSVKTTSSRSKSKTTL